LEDALALVSQINERRRVIRALSYHETNWDQVHSEATAMRRDLLKLKGILSERWEELFAEIEGDGEG
jgi:hypothetical protein